MMTERIVGRWRCQWRKVFEPMANVFRGSSDREEERNKENEVRDERQEKRSSKPSGKG